MADVRDELLLIVVRLRDLIRHEIQGLRKVAHLILRVRRDLVMVVAGGILRGSLRDSLQRAVDDDIEDGERCVKCKDYFPKSTLLAGYCKDCGDAINEAFREKISTFSPDEIAFLNEIYDGRWLDEN